MAASAQALRGQVVANAQALLRQMLFTTARSKRRRARLSLVSHALSEDRSDYQSGHTYDRGGEPRQRGEQCDACCAVLIDAVSRAMSAALTSEVRASRRRLSDTTDRLVYAQIGASFIEPAVVVVLAPSRRQARLGSTTVASLASTHSYYVRSRLTCRFGQMTRAIGTCRRAFRPRAAPAVRCDRGPVPANAREHAARVKCALRSNTRTGSHAEAVLRPHLVEHVQVASHASAPSA